MPDDPREPRVWRVYSDSGHAQFVVAVERATAAAEYEQEHPGEMVLRCVDCTSEVGRILGRPTLEALVHRANRGTAGEGE